VSALVLRVGVENETGRLAPVGAVTDAAEQGITGPVFNEYAFGAYLIYVGIPPFIDGRADMYGDAALRRSKTLADLPALLDEHRVTWTLLKPDNPQAVLLDHLPGWRRIHADAIAVVHARRQPLR
jgi:hypothetical protein